MRNLLGLSAAGGQTRYTETSLSSEKRTDLDEGVGAADGVFRQAVVVGVPYVVKGRQGLALVEGQMRPEVPAEIPRTWSDDLWIPLRLSSV